MAGELRETIEQLHAATDGKVDSLIPPILFHGVRHVYEPINIHMDDVIELYNHGMPIFVRMEPGDATRYDILVTPLHGGGGLNAEGRPRPGIFSSYGVKPAEWVFVSQVNLRKQTTFMRLDSRWDANWYLDELMEQNDFTRLAMCWFVAYLSLKLGH